MHLALTLMLYCVASFPFSEDFHAVEEGGLPKGWSGDDCVAVCRYKSFTCLQATDKGMHYVRTPNLPIRGDFQLDLQVLLPWSGVGLDYDSEFQVTLKGENTGSDLLMTFVQIPGLWLEYPGLSKWKVKVDKGIAKEIGVRKHQPICIHLERKGDIYRLTVGDETILAKRMSRFGDFSGVEIGLTGPSDARGSSVASVISISIRPFPQGPEDTKKHNRENGKPRRPTQKE